MFKLYQFYSIKQPSLSFVFQSKIVLDKYSYLLHISAKSGNLSAAYVSRTTSYDEDLLALSERP